MIHWPDSMFTYLVEDGVLFSSDGFGQHYAGPEKFDDQVGTGLWCTPRILCEYPAALLSHIEKLIRAGGGHEPRYPHHLPGPRRHLAREPAKIVQAYLQWCRQEPERKAVVIYDTMWHSTEKMAEAINAGILAEGVAPNR